MNTSTSRSSSAPERVALILQEELLEGAYPVGTRFKEERLAARFNVGRNTVRSALRLLVSEGLIDHQPNRGVGVPPLSRTRIDEVFDYRKVLELGALDIALASKSDFSEVVRAVESFEALAGRSAAPSWGELTLAHGGVHEAIVASAGNRHLTESYRRCQKEIRLLLTFVRPDFDPKTMSELHRSLLTELLRGGDEARKALADDIDCTGRAALLAALQRAEDAARLIGR